MNSKYLLHEKKLDKKKLRSPLKPPEALDQMKSFFRENDKLGRYQIFLWKILLKEAKLASERKLY